MDEVRSLCRKWSAPFQSGKKSLPNTHKFLRYAVALLLTERNGFNVLHNIERIADLLNAVVEVERQDGINAKFTGKHIADAFENGGDEHSLDYDSLGFDDNTHVVYIRPSIQTSRGSTRTSSIGCYWML